MLSSVSKEKLGRDGVCLLFWYRFMGIVINYSDCGNNDSNLALISIEL